MWSVWFIVIIISDEEISFGTFSPHSEMSLRNPGIAKSVRILLKIETPSCWNASDATILVLLHVLSGKTRRGI